MNINWEAFAQYYEAINNHLIANVEFISNSIAATTLVILSRDIDKLFRDNVKKQLFVVRTSLFILVCGLGYEVATQVLERLLLLLLQQIGFIYLIPILIAVFILLGLGAERKKYI